MLTFKNTLKIIFIFLFLFTALNCAYADAPDPGEFVISEINRMIPVLEHQNFRKDKDRIKFERSIIDFLKSRFDWTLIAERTLNKHWKTLSPEQQKDFTDALYTLVQNLCLSAATRYNGQTADLVTETLEGNKANVYLRYNSDSGKKYDVLVYLTLTDKGWKAYDILAEGVSLSDNYKAQFKSIIENFTISKLLNMMTERSNEE